MQKEDFLDTQNLKELSPSKPVLEEILEKHERKSFRQKENETW